MSARYRFSDAVDVRESARLQALKALVDNAPLRSPLARQAAPLLIALLAACGSNPASDDEDGSGGEGGTSQTGGATQMTGGKSGSAAAGGATNAGRTGAAGGRAGAPNGSVAGRNGAAGTAGTAGGPVVEGPPAGNPDGRCAIPSEAALEDTSRPDRVVGMGTPESCTGDAFIAAVAAGGVIRFDCGPRPVAITLDRPAKVFNDASDDVVIDGGGLVTLSGGGRTRILYMNTCDEEQVWTTDHCDDQETPRLTVQNLTFVNGNSKGESEFDGGGAIWARGGRFKVINSRFFNNVCADEGPDVGGAAIRVFSQYRGLPAYVVNSTFGGAEGRGNVGANGGGIGSIGVSWTVLNSVFSHNRAIGRGGNPAEVGTPGGGSGGAIYNDGNTMTLTVCGTRIEHNQVNAYGSAIFFVSNTHTGTVRISDSIIRNNAGGGWNVLPGISMHEDTVQVVENSTIQ